jgi:Dolichyl-phosphate-mannose-protein mannosyltransferase
MRQCGNSLYKHGLWIWAALLWTSVQLPFISGPFRIDDPYHLEASKQMQRAPGDPYGFRINWDGTPKSAFVTYASPPLVPAWLALWSRFFPENEVSLHVAMLPFSIVALVTLGVLARSFELRASIAMALLACSPAFFLTSQVLMPDMPMLCLFLLAVSGARLYQFNRSWSALLVACLAGFCCPLAKYNGAVLVPVLISLGLAGEHRIEAANTWSGDRSVNQPRRAWSGKGPQGFTPGMIAIISAPIFSLVCWGAFTWLKYGAVHFLRMSTFQRGQAHSMDPATLTAGILGAVGLGVVPLSLLGFLCRSRNSFHSLSVLTLCSGVGAAWLAVLIRYGLSSVLLFAFSVSIAVFMVGLVVRLGWQSAREGDWSLLPLVVWILAGLAFQYGLMFSAVRYILFLAPPMILLALRLSSWVPAEPRLRAMLGANLLFVAALGFADARQAKVYPSVVAEEIRPRLEISGGRLFFDGHWGFQYYASQIGGTPIDELRPPSVRAGDLVVVAKQPWPKLKHAPPAKGLDIETTTLEVPGSGFLRTLSCSAGANFYSSVASDCDRPTLLPFGFSWEPAESFVLYSFKKPGAENKASLAESGK